MQLHESIGIIKGIGEKTEKLFAKMDVFTVEDLLEHYPRGYDAFEEIIPVSEAKVGQTATFEVSLVAALQVKKIRNLTMLTGRARDYSGDIILTWFNMPFLKNTVKMGTHYIVRGMVARKNNMLVLDQPKILSKEEYVNKLHVLQPIYPLTFGLTNNAVTKAITQVLKEVDLTGDYLPSNPLFTSCPYMHKKYPMPIGFIPNMTHLPNINPKISIMIARLFQINIVLPLLFHYSCCSFSSHYTKNLFILLSFYEGKFQDLLDKKISLKPI